ncbi:MAG TPA: FG-GAP-like repeat-containing protein [Bacteroidales bacterium]|nr:FG-GAP-like repeat-containing protein [Bacteroidales bacterium]
MKNRNILLLAAFCVILSGGCRNGGNKSGDKLTDLITVKTLGLAYLEEFKLEDAEQQFRKFIDLAPGDKFGYANLGLTYLRMAKYPEAEKELNKAIKIDAQDPDVRLILATVFKMNNEKEKAVSELKKALEFAPGHLKILYEITELYSTMPDSGSARQRENYLHTLVEKAPANLVPRLSLTDILIRNGELDKALEQMEIINKQFPEFPKEAVEYYNKTVSLLRKKDKDNAVIQYTIFHNYLKVTSPYQAGIMDLKGPGGSLIGFPVITFDRQPSTRAVENESLLDVIKFTDASSAAGLDIVSSSGGSGSPGSDYSAHVETCDYDGDGDIDIYAGSYDKASSTYRHFLLNNEMGKFTDVTKAAGLKHSGKENSALFADFDNDGYEDLFIMTEGGDILYKNTGKGTFEDVTAQSGAGSRTGGRSALAFDMDHDGDLDILEILGDRNLYLRNEGDGTFQDQSQRLGQQPGTIHPGGAVFGDFDDDEDVDFIVVNEDGIPAYYSNQRQGVYRDIVQGSGLQDLKGASVITAGDFNNDGYLDLFIGSDNGNKNNLYVNQRDGKFLASKSNEKLFSALDAIKVHDAKFLDFNNDGFLDLLVAGESVEKGRKAMFLLYNDGHGIFRDVSQLLPQELNSGKQITLFDYNDDGDIDAVVAGTNGGVTLLRNDGGNNNHFITMKLVGLKAGSAKNNHFGIGAKIEVRAGDLYQTLVVTDPNIHFGIGNRSRADIIRIRWTNGVPQNIFMPGSDQALIEEQTLKGSCPFLYTWNGEEYTFVKDILWRSALGMPTGIMGGNTAYAFADASDDYIKIPGELLKPRQGKYSIQVTSELWETIYLDQIQLVAVDHPANSDIFVPEQFSPPPFPGLQIIKINGKRAPVSAIDGEGNDILPFIEKKDDKYLSDFKTGKYQGITEMRDIVIDAGESGNNPDLYLFMTGWIFPTDASINFAMAQSDLPESHPPVIQAVNEKGEWETIADNIGFPMGKDKTVIVNLSGKFITKDHRLRIRTNMQIYWDEIFFASSVPGIPAVTTVIDPLRADLHYRGFSKLYRKGGRYGPHWFDYSSVEKGPKWRDLTGNYTRFGDVLPLLTKPDNQYAITNAGDETTIEFSEKDLPALPEGWKRDFLIHSVGWVKDGDLNTAFGNTVLPLPFHGMKNYPPSAEDAYPDSRELREYNKKYNTRVVTGNEYINALRGNDR